MFIQIFFYFSENSSNKKFLNDSITKVVKYVFNLAGELSGITGQVGLFSIMTVRMEELISHYSRLQEYVTYAGETFVELDRSVSSDIKSKGK